jgi:site-specific DNA-adenine methylase
MLKYFKDNSLDQILIEIKDLIEKYQLSKTNQEGFNNLRKYYNTENKSPIVLYTMICFAFNYQIRFNSKDEYNMPFGKDRSSFNQTLENKLCEFVKTLHNKDCYFYNKNFMDIKINNLSENDLIYCDPPYFAGSVATYNENGGWTETNEQNLLDLLTQLNQSNIKFALSNVLEHKGEQNKLLIDWSKSYNIHYLDKNYNNCNYQLKNKALNTVEVLITNY